jgi:chloramphenicol 3-O phosphotransferase
MSSHIIFLHGASSSAKSTIARALQARIEKPFWHVSIDHLRDSGVIPTARFKRGDFRWADSRTAFFDGFHVSIGAYAGAGNNLILEHIIDHDAWVNDLQKVFTGHDVFFVAIHCQLETLVQRELARGDRPAGSAKRDFETIHVGRRYDLELKSEDGVERNVETLLSAWRVGRRSSEFHIFSAG